MIVCRREDGRWCGIGEGGGSDCVEVGRQRLWGSGMVDAMIMWIKVGEYTWEIAWIQEGR